MTTYYDERGRRLDLVGEGHRGGEGSVHRISGDAARVAKIYHAGRLSSAVHIKLRVMLEQPPVDPSWTSTRHRSIAWVDGLIFGDTSGRDFRGFTMPYVDTGTFRQAHVYYDAADRLQLFGGEFTWRHLLYSAHNLASAVAAVHAAGHRVGDLRETNLLVAPSSLVTLIDCDSFQILDRRTQVTYPTRVATGDYLPPELQGVDFRTASPDRYHGDLFGLAVLIFRFLMLGVHPFQARGTGVTDAPTTEAKIRKGLFAFAGRGRGVEPPEYAPPYAVLPSSIQDLFSRAFIRGHSDPPARPPAGEWVIALAAEGQRLATCRTNANHSYAHGVRACPWCKMSRDPFPARMLVGRQIALDGAPAQIPEAARVAQVREYARVALADGALTDREFWYLRKAGGELGLKTAVIDRVIDDESRRSVSSIPNGNGNGSSPAPAAAQATPTSTSSQMSGWSRIRTTLPHPTVVLSAARKRPFRSALKASAPVLVACALAGALAPVIAPLVAAVVGLPMLATVGEARSTRGWLARARMPWRFGVYVHHALGHAARVFAPFVLLGVAASYAPEFRPDWVARGLGASATVALAIVTILRLPFAPDRFAKALRAGRDLVWRSLVGDTGRARRPLYGLWALCLGAAAAIAMNTALWWPLPIR
jgi:hypothetical protein